MIGYLFGFLTDPATGMIWLGYVAVFAAMNLYLEYPVLRRRYRRWRAHREWRGTPL
jgi:hypothetical protein